MWVKVWAYIRSIGETAKPVTQGRVMAACINVKSVTARRRGAFGSGVETECQFVQNFTDRISVLTTGGIKMSRT